MTPKVKWYATHDEMYQNLLAAESLVNIDFHDDLNGLLFHPQTGRIAWKGSITRLGEGSVMAKILMDGEVKHFCWFYPRGKLYFREKSSAVLKIFPKDYPERVLSLLEKKLESGKRLKTIQLLPDNKKPRKRYKILSLDWDYIDHYSYSPKLSKVKLKRAMEVVKACKPKEIHICTSQHYCRIDIETLEAFEKFLDGLTF